MELDALYAQRLQTMRAELTTLTGRVGRIETTLISMRLSRTSSRGRPPSPRPVARSSPRGHTLGMRLDQTVSQMRNHRLWSRLGKQAILSGLEKITTWGIGLATPTAIIYLKQAWGWASPSLQALRSWLGL